MEMLGLMIALFIFMDAAYGFILYIKRAELFDKVFDGTKMVTRVDGGIAVMTLYLLSMEVACITDYIVAMK